MNNAVRIFSCRSNVNGLTNWTLTDDENEAKQYQTYELATLKEIHNWLRISNDIFSGKLHIKEGIVEWYQNESDEDDFGYKLLLENKKRSA